MQKIIKISGQEIKYQLKSNYRSKNIRLSIYRDGRFIITKPRRISNNVIEKFIISKANWIIEKLKKTNNNLLLSKEEARKRYQQYKEPARHLINKKIDHFNQFYNFKFNRVSVRDQKTRWGSCSRQGNLNFSYRILFLPEELANYIIVHELCHLAEFNHSKDFWSLVSQVVPNYLTIRRDLKNYRTGF